MRSPLPLLVLALALVGRTAAAAPGQQRLSLIGDPRTSIGISWTTSGDSAGVVQFGRSTSYGQQQSAGPAQLVDGVGYVHEVALSGLTAGTLYHYRVGDGTSFTEDAQFTTAPSDPCQAWRFVAMGDDRTQFGEGGHAGVSKNFPSILEEAAAVQPALIVNTGDLVKDGTDPAQWIDYLDTTEPVARRIPMLPAIGNHDDDSVVGDGARYNDLFQLPRNEVTHTEDYYLVRYLNAVFVVLSTQTYLDGTATDRRTMAAQATWLDEVLAEHADATWKIVAYHHPSVSGGGLTIAGYGIGHPGDEAGANEALLPVLDRHRVDLVLVGHNHWYERFLPARQNPEAPTEVVLAGDASAGTVHITTGGAGAYTMEFDWIPFFDICVGDVDGMRTSCSGAHHFVVVDVSAGQLDLQTWTTRCQNFNCDAEPALIDSYRIAKPALTACQPRPDAGRDSASAGDATASDRAASDRRDGGSAIEASTITDAVTGGGENGGAVAQEGCHCAALSMSASVALCWLALGLLGWRRRAVR